MFTRYTDKQREKLFNELTADKSFMEFAREEFEERKGIEGIFRFREVFEEDLKDNLEHYNTIWEDRKLIDFLEDTDEETAQEIMNSALNDVLKDFKNI